MTAHVVDASVVIKWFVDEIHAEEAAANTGLSTSGRRIRALQLRGVSPTARLLSRG